MYKSFQAGDVEGIVSRLPDDFVAHVYGQDAGLPWGGDFHGKNGLVQGFLAPLAQHTKTNSLQVTHLAETTDRIFAELKWDTVCHGVPLLVEHEMEAVSRVASFCFGLRSVCLEVNGAHQISILPGGVEAVKVTVWGGTSAAAALNACGHLQRLRQLHITCPGYPESAVRPAIASHSWPERHSWGCTRLLQRAEPMLLRL
ncbi:hypothetical protein WJX72_001235 [[Myrmecia] bisecta]|uniref:Uncharacterized protein n=1 Tax=[Myrmecia] bisecta TaxID=41462 RepID=A0AAW1Q2J4_9CHLO